MLVHNCVGRVGQVAVHHRNMYNSHYCEHLGRLSPIICICAYRNIYSSDLNQAFKLYIIMFSMTIASTG